MRPPPLPHQTQNLQLVLDRVSSNESASRAPVVVFDLDATLYDNRPRTLEILMQYRNEIIEEQPDIGDALSTLDTHRIEYLLSDTLRGCGITSAVVVADITRYWHDRFFTDEYLRYDVPLDSAVEYVGACYEAGAIIVYLTGRDIPGMFLGTVASLRDEGFPIGITGTELVLKPDANLSDEAFLRAALPTLDRLGDLVGFFDNEPTNCNLAHAIYPDCTVVLLETQKVPYAPEPDPDVRVVTDFRR